MRSPSLQNISTFAKKNEKNNADNSNSYENDDLDKTTEINDGPYLINEIKRKRYNKHEAF